ncbi:MAG: PEP/pyruvate-binding domain-containing protein [Nitrospirota bacterium]|jgi:pyruvate,water dikinase
MGTFSEMVRSIFRKLEGRPGGFAKRLDLKEAFRLYKEVLESNNRALMVITDMGEKLGGDFIFDINYVRKAYADLSADIRGSIERFDLLTGGRHDAAGAFNRVDSLIRAMVYGTAPASGKLVVFYDDISWDMVRDVGGKNYHLSELRNMLGLKVPEAFALTGAAYDAYMEHNGIRQMLTAGDAADTEGGLETIREAVAAGEFPPGLDRAIGEAVATVARRAGGGGSLAVRSSAEEEDGDLSFAGQFMTVLNVPLEKEAVKEAYRKVVASLFAPGALQYQKQHGYAAGSLRMPVGCVLMVDARSSGVLYTADPVGGREESLLINAAWGLGSTVVDGRTDADLFIVGKKPALHLEEARIGEKQLMAVAAEGGGTKEVETPPEMRSKPSLSEEDALELASIALEIERYYKRPQDVEWARGADGGMSILQSRPLVAAAAPAGPAPCRDELKEALARYPVLMSNRGRVVQKGVAGGKVFVVKNAADLDHFPRGAVLVAKHDSPQYVRVMPYAAAIITDTGAPTSHMASICREFRVPAVVNAGVATQSLAHGQEITLSAEEDGSATVYAGLAEELLQVQAANSRSMEDLYEFRRKRYLMRYISPLNLINPLVDEFTAEKCRTMHDILRFIHEKAVQALVDASVHAEGHAAFKRLDLPIPAGIHVIDIGGGLVEGKGEKVSVEEVTSLPLRAIVKGMMHPGAWHTEPVSLGMRDFLSSMVRMQEPAQEQAGFAGNNIAVVSREYMNLTLRFGYHFNLVDCFCSERAGNNHVYFRFVGGATDITKRSRRIRLIEEILREYGFISTTKGDLIIARLSHVGRDEILDILEKSGRLIAFTRQLDAVLDSDSDVERFKRNFLEDKYELAD